MRPLNFRRRLFVEYFLRDPAGSAAEAARRAGYRCPETLGPRLLKTPAIQAAISARVRTAALAADEVLARLSDVASADLFHFIRLEANGDWNVDLRAAKRLGMGHLIKRIRKKKDGSTDIELEPRMLALSKIGAHLSLWKGEGNEEITMVDVAKHLEERYERLRQAQSGQ